MTAVNRSYIVTGSTKAVVAHACEAEHDCPTCKLKLKAK
jgi:hypothetical protein